MTWVLKAIIVLVRLVMLDVGFLSGVAFLLLLPYSGLEANQLCMSEAHAVAHDGTRITSILLMAAAGPAWRNGPALGPCEVIPPGAARQPQSKRPARSVRRHIP